MRGATLFIVYLLMSKLNFNPRPPRGERLPPPKMRGRKGGFQSTPPAWGATRSGDRVRAIYFYFNPRPPRGERQKSFKIAHFVFVFQSTPPAWGATAAPQAAEPIPNHFNPRPPRGERPMQLNTMRPLLRFQSTPPAWGATRLNDMDVVPSRISIHAPRVGSDRATG